MNSQTFIDQFVKNGYFEYPINNQVLNLKLKQIQNYWAKFRTQPLDHKNIHIFNEKRGGYEYKNPSNLDFKENFHVSLLYQLPPNSSHVDKFFINKSKEFILDSFDVLSGMLDVFDHGAQSKMKNLVLDSIQKWQLRFLYYPPRLDFQNQNEFLAHSHVDKGITTHWHEDAPGLEILWNDKWVPVFGKHGFVHGYFGLSGQFYSECRFPALCHRVVSNESTLKSGRTSIVMFHDFGGVYYNKNIYGSTQQAFPNGENYKMTHQEFSKYFKTI